MARFPRVLAFCVPLALVLLVGAVVLGQPSTPAVGPAQEKGS